MTYVTTRDKKVIHVEETPMEEETRLQQLRKRLHALEAQAKAAEAEKKRRGYCLTCHLLLTQSGKCNKCGTIWQFHTRGEHLRLNLN